MNIGGKNTCACGWCYGCNLLWAPTLYILSEDKATRRLEKWLSLPKWKLHSDGHWTKLSDEFRGGFRFGI